MMDQSVANMVNTAMNAIQTERERLATDIVEEHASQSLYRRTVAVFSPRLSRASQALKRRRGRPADQVHIILYLLDRPSETVPSLKKKRDIEEMGLGVPLTLTGYDLAAATKRKVLKRVEFSSVEQLKKDVGKGKLYIIPKRQLMQDDMDSENIQHHWPSSSSDSSSEFQDNPVCPWDSSSQEVNSQDSHLPSTSLRAARARQLPEEPDHGIEIKFRTSSNYTVTRRFLPEHSSETITNFVGSLDEASEHFQIKPPNGPPLDLTTLRTIRDLGLSDRTLLHVLWFTEEASVPSSVESNQPPGENMPGPRQILQSGENLQFHREIPSTSSNFSSAMTPSSRERSQLPTDTVLAAQRDTSQSQTNSSQIQPETVTRVNQNCQRDTSESINSSVQTGCNGLNEVACQDLPTPPIAMRRTCRDAAAVARARVLEWVTTMSGSSRPCSSAPVLPAPATSTVQNSTTLNDLSRPDVIVTDAAFELELDVHHEKGETLISHRSSTESLPLALKSLAEVVLGNVNDGNLKIIVRRSSALSDALQNISRSHCRILQPLAVRFIAEPAVDEGGPTRELSSEAVKQLTQSSFVEGGEKKTFPK